MVLFHADVGREEGWGHFSECLSVAAALRERGVRCGFVIPAQVEVAGEKAEEEGYRIFALPTANRGTAPLTKAVSELITRTSACLVANLVTLSAPYAEEVSRATDSWAVITEHAEQERAPVNFNISCNPEYMPLHKVYCNAAPRHIQETVQQILLCFGGTDPKNACGLVLEMLRQGFERSIIPRLRINVILGPLFEHSNVVRAMSDTYPVKLEVKGPVTPEQLAQSAQQADLAITTGGGTMYEFCAMGLPSVVVPVLDKMATNAKVLQRKGAVLCTTRMDRLSARELIKAVVSLLDRQVRDAMAKAAQSAIDGRGAERISKRLFQDWGLG